MSSESNQEMEPSSSTSMSLIIRVKRRRIDEPAETICLFDDNQAMQQKKRKSIIDEMASQLTLKDTAMPPVKRNKLILKRVSTVENSREGNLDELTMTAANRPRKRKDGVEDNADEVNRETSLTAMKRAKVLVTQSSKSISLPGFDNNIVLVDSMQIYEQPIIPPPSSSINSNTQQVTPTKTKILDPPTRLLERGILTALHRGDFTEISSALIQGANPEYQLENTKGGYTALMVAAIHGNLRMIERLLLRNVNVLIKNTNGQMAYDLIIKETNRNRIDCEKIRYVLEKAASKQQVVSYHIQNQENECFLIRQTLQQQQQQQQSTPIASQKLMANHLHQQHYEEDYVVDIYTVDDDTNTVTNLLSTNAPPVTTSATTTAATTTSTEVEETIFSILKVEGLRIDDTGRVELVAYDSEWSDLADDEDPDSNDERYYANDYPEESDEDNGGQLFDDNDDKEEEGINSKSNNNNNNNGEDNLENVDDIYEVHPNKGLQQHHHHHHRRHHHHHPYPSRKHSSSHVKNAVEEEEEGEEGEEDHHHSDGDGLDVDGTNLDVDDAEDNEDQEEEEEKEYHEGVAEEEEEDADDEDDLAIEGIRGTKTRAGTRTGASSGGVGGRTRTNDIEQEINQFFHSQSNQSPHNNHHNNRTSLPIPIPPDVNMVFDTRKTGIGRVLKPFHLPTTQDDQHYPQQEEQQQQHTTESLQVLWDEIEDEPITTERVEAMRSRTGMIFAANPREFDRENGLPKYGMELSDEDDEEEEEVNVHSVERSLVTNVHHKPALDTIAYDSELDHSD
jgi:hypothetical protein